MNPDALLNVLADGELHSGALLAAESGLTRAAIWKSIRKLSRWGLNVESVAGRGYRLSEAVELLNAAELNRELAADHRFSFDQLEVFTEIDSTNAYLMRNPPAGPNALRVCIAEWQSSGRGRLERRWNSPLGSGLCISVAWTYSGTPGDLSSLSLAAGVAVADAVYRSCGVQTALKWPNDLLWNGRKLGGILVESRFEAQGSCNVVIGTGLNVAVPPETLAAISDWPAGAVDLRTANESAAPSRHSLAIAVAGSLGELLVGMQERGAEFWLTRWRERDFLHAKDIRVHSSAGILEGTACGIDDDGALLVRIAGGDVRRVVAGDASVRSQ